MNILIIPAFFQTKRHPTAGSFFWDQALALKNAGHNVTILYCDTYSVKCIGEYIGYDEQNSQCIDDINIYRKRVFCPLKHWIEGHREQFANGILQLYEKYILHQQSIDIIHAHCCVWAGYSAMKLSEKTSIPYIITEHATLFRLHRDEISDKNNEYITKAFRNASKVVCVSHAFGQLLGEYTTDIQIIGNVVDCEMFHMSKAVNESTENKEYRFLTVCYMEEEAQLYKKGIDILIEAWAEVAHRHQNAKLIIGGGGKAVSKVAEWIEKYNVPNSVKLIGALNRSEVSEQMRQCDCFVLPSRYETFGVVYIEAFACGKPVIAAANGGPDDFVKEFNGLLINPGDKNELVEALEEMIKPYERNETVYQPEKIVNYVKENFSSDAIALKLDELYKSIV